MGSTIGFFSEEWGGSEGSGRFATRVRDSLLTAAPFPPPIRWADHIFLSCKWAASTLARGGDADRLEVVTREVPIGQTLSLFFIGAMAAEAEVIKMAGGLTHLPLQDGLIPMPNEGKSS